MALVLKDRVKETSVSTGTGDISLAGASGAYQAFSTIGNGNQTYYAIAGQTTTEWEVGIGTYVSSGNKITRDTILSSSNSNTIVTFSAGTKDVFITYPSEKAIYEEPDGDTLINAGPITVLGPGVSGIPTPYTDTLGRFYGNQDAYQQVYIQNQYNGVDASTDLVAYNDLGDGTNYFIDMGMASSSYSSAFYPLFTENSAYLYNSGLTTGTGAAGETSELLIGTGTINSDLVLFTGGVDTTNEAVRISGADQTIEVQKGVTLNETLDVTGAATFGSTVLLDADPTLNLQAATKQYVDTAVATGLHLHQPVLVATTGNLTASYSNGTAGVGATLTNSGTQVALAIDGINMATTNRVLVWQQSASVQNGIYDVTTVGSGSTNWVLTRSSDANTYVPQSDTGLGGGDYFFVQSGTLGAGDSYVCTNDGVIVFGTTPITFAQFSGAITYVGGTNIDVTGQTISLTGTVAATNGGTGTATVTTGDLLYGSATNTWSKLTKGSAYQSLVMNGSGTQVEWNAINLSSSAAVTGSLGATLGGTGQTTYATGDTLYSSAANTISKLSGNTSTTKQYLSQTGTGSASAAPSWATISAADIGAGTLPAVRGGTGQSAYAVGDLLYADTTTTLAKLADVATGNALISGGLSTAPAWGKIGLTTHVSGTLPIANGGTNGTATPTAGGIAYGTGTAYAVNSAGTLGQYLTSGAAGAPTWTTLPTNVASISFGSTGLTPSTATTGAVTVAGTLAVANGGTASTTAQGAMNTLAGATTSGSYLRGNGTNVVMATIVAGDVPTLNQNTTGTASNVTGVVAAVNGGTGQSSYAVGDIVYASTTTALSKLADVATGNALISGGVGVAPSYGKIGLTTHVSGTLPVTNGGTNASVAGITAFNNITGYSAAGATGTTSTNLVFSTSPTLVTPVLGTPTSGTLTSCTGLPISTGVSGLGTGVATFLATPTSANLLSAITGETGTGALVFDTAPTFTTSINGGATFGAFAASTALTIGYTGTGAASTTNISTAALTGVFTKTINIGTGGTTSSTTTINMGSATNGSTIIRGSLAVGSVTANTTDGAIWASNNVTAYAASDIKFKTNIKSIPNAVEKVQLIGGKTFDWTDEYIASMGGEHKYFMQRSDAGVIAQDVQKAMPELTRKREDGSLAVDYPKLVALAFAAIVELKAEIDALKKAK